MQALLSHKLDCKLLPSFIPENEYNMLVDDIKATKIDTGFKYGKFRTVDLISHCYKRDDNEIPVLYKVNDRSSIIPGYQAEVSNQIENW